MSSASRRSRIDTFPAWALWPVLAVAAALRLIGLGRRSLWTDEGSTWTAATLDWKHLIERCVGRDASPPLYYVFTSWALKLGDGEAQLRLVSMLASLVMVWLTYRLARLATTRGPATFAALLASVSTYQVMYAQEARTYALAGMFLLAGLYLFARAFLHGKRSAWLPYVLVSALGLWTQTIAGLGLAAQVALIALLPEGRRRWLSFVLAQLAVVALYAPWLVATSRMGDHLSSSHWYIDSPEAVGVFKVFRAVLAAPLPLVGSIVAHGTPGLDRFLPRPLAWLLLLGLVALPLVASLEGLLHRGGRRSATALLWAGWLLPILGVTAISFRTPLLLPRYFVFATIPVAALLAIGVAGLPGRALRWAWGLGLVAISLFGLWRYERDYAKEPWRDVAAYVSAAATPGRTAVLVPFDVDPYAYYNRHTRDRVAAFEYSHPDEPFAAHFSEKQFAEMSAAARARLKDYPDVWVVVRSPNNPDRKRAAADADRVAAEGRREAGRSPWSSPAGGLLVTHWVRAEVPAPVPADSLPIPRRRAEAVVTR